MRWYLNDSSLQGQFVDVGRFVSILRDLVKLRNEVPAIRQDLRLTRSWQIAMVSPEINVRRTLVNLSDRDFRAATLSWLDKTGPFVDDDRLHEADDYFEYQSLEVTGSGLGEAARQTKAGVACATYSFVGGEIDFALSVLKVDHGLPEERYGCYRVTNVWDTRSFGNQARSVDAPIRSWSELVTAARRRFSNLEIGELHANPALAREPFEASLRDRCLHLMKVLDDYVTGRDQFGVDGPAAKEIIENYFTGDRALFTGESASNREQFSADLTFQRVSGGVYFAPWHGKISHRHFRMHVEWPLKKGRERLEVFYFGPKITKN